MKNPELIPRVDGTFPNVVTRADSGVGLKDGTPVHKRYIQDLLGAFQAILNGASLTPVADAPETCGATAGDVTGSQIVEALQLMLCVPGTYHWYAGDTIPPGARLLKCTGTLASRTYNITGMYSRLLNVWVGPNPANADLGKPAFFRTSDDTGTIRDEAGDYLVIPNLDGRFMRARDLGELLDTQGSTREFGDVQVFMSGTHSHNGLLTGATGLEYLEVEPEPGPVTHPRGTLVPSGDEIHTTNTGIGMGLENRPYNTVGTICISY
jgi:hypothetical protein